MTATLLRAHPFDEAYAARVPALQGGAWVQDLRRSARGILAQGLPGPKIEEWRFTPLTQVLRGAFVPAAAADDIDVTAVPPEFAVRRAYPRGYLLARVTTPPGPRLRGSLVESFDQFE